MRQDRREKVMEIRKDNRQERRQDFQERRTDRRR